MCDAGVSVVFFDGRVDERQLGLSRAMVESFIFKKMKLKTVAKDNDHATKIGIHRERPFSWTWNHFALVLNMVSSWKSCSLLNMSRRRARSAAGGAVLGRG